MHTSGGHGRHPGSDMRIVARPRRQRVFAAGHRLTGTPTRCERSCGRAAARSHRSRARTTRSSSRTGTGRRWVCSPLRAPRTKPSKPYPLDARRQGRGDDRLLLQQERQRAAFETRLAAMLPLLEVDAAEPAGRGSTKPSGPIYSEGRGPTAIARRKKHWAFKPDGGSFRPCRPLSPRSGSSGWSRRRVGLLDKRASCLFAPERRDSGDVWRRAAGPPRGGGLVGVRR